MDCAATPQHQWLRKYLGTWAYASMCPTEPGGEPQKFEGRETVRMIGDFWVVGEAVGAMPDGSEARMITTVGYDPAKERFVGSWIGSMMHHMWIYEGWLEGDDTLVLESTGPAWGEPTPRMTKFRDTTTFRGADLRIMRGTMLQSDGSWTQMMEMEFRRVR